MSRLARRVEPFFAIGQVSGGPLLVATIVALVAVNTSFSAAYEQFWDAPIRISYGGQAVSHSLAEWINDALMPLFFLIIGTEVKREFVKGSLSSVQTAALPVAGAIGGLVVPIALFLAFNHAEDTRRAWGVVAAMDTAFSLAVVAMFTTRLPAAVRAVLLAFAAIDDVFGLLVIAVAYTAALKIMPLVAAGAAFLLLIALLRLRWVSSIPYVLLGIVVWVGVFGSGVHATIAGVALGLLLPTSSRLSERRFAERVQEPVDRFKEAHRAARRTTDEDEGARKEEEAQKHLGYIHEMAAATDEAAERLVRVLTPWVSYVVLPLFALAHVRVHLSPELVADAIQLPLALGIVAGLAVGKPVGFVLATWLAVKVGGAKLPADVTWRMILGVGAVAGIGFTLSLFIAELALSNSEQAEAAGFAILVASLLSAGFGYLVLRSAANRRDALAPQQSG